MCIPAYSLDQAVGILQNLEDGTCPPSSQELEKLYAQLTKNNPFADLVAEEMGTSKESITDNLFQILTPSA